MDTTKELIEEGARLVIECRQLLSEVETILNEQKRESEVNKYRKLLEEVRCDNVRLYRENKLLRSKLQQSGRC